MPPALCTVGAPAVGGAGASLVLTRRVHSTASLIHFSVFTYLLRLHRSAIIVLTTNGLLMIINHLEPAIISHLACLIVS